MADIISIGDSTEDVFLKVDEATILCEAHHKDCKLCFSYASKIPVKEVHKLIGGNSANTAIGSARLGLKSAFYSEVGNDESGKVIFNTLKKNKVNTKYFKLNPKTVTNYSAIINLGAERTILIYHVKRKYQLPKLEKSKWVYLSSMGEGCEIVYKDLISYLKKNKVKLAFNPGTYQLRQGLKLLKPLFEITDVLFLNKEECQSLINNKSEDYKILLKGMKLLGSKICVLTDGPKGAFAYDGTKFYSCGVFNVPVVERTGCGDSFSIAFVCALFYNKDIKEALRWGAANSASVIQYIGPQEGLLDFKGMNQYLERFKNVKVKEI